MPVFIVLLGPPGAGKGTQAQMISEKLNLPHVSSGDIFRENLKGKTELGQKAQAFMDRGELVPDDLTIAMIGERISRPDCKNGALLDGFPRTPAQAKALNTMLEGLGGKVNCVPYIAVPEGDLVKRLGGRWTCPTCGRAYHEEFNPPKADGKCDDDQAELYQREDDKPETVARRIRVYMEQTAPLIGFYEESGVLAEINGALPIETVSQVLLDAIEKFI
jgi:adenylate kinase